MRQPVIRARSLSHAYGEVLALDRIDLEIPPGRVGLVGANGAGKTTLLRILLGMLTPTAGEVEVLGDLVAERLLAVRSRVGYLPEGSCLPPDQTAADFVAYAAELAGLPARVARRRSSEVLFLVGLHEERFRYLGGFSTGMAQRVKLAQSIVHDPDLVLLDEPASGLDPEGRDQMLELIVRLGDSGINVVVSSHLLGDIERTCEWVVMLDGGRVVRAGPLGELGRRDALTVELLDDPAPVVAELAARGATVSQDGRLLEVRLAAGDPFDLVRDVLADTGAGVHRLGVAVATLEEVFLAEAAKGGGDD